MREIVAYCDRCWADGERREPSKGQMTIAMMSGDVSHPTPKVLDFCEPCLKEVAVLAELVAGSAILPTRRTTAPTTGAHSTPSKVRLVPCPVCRASTARASLVGHIWVQHRDDIRPEAPLTCPDCNKPYDSGQGMATHRRIAHGHDALTEALSGVKGYRITGKEREL